MFYCEPCRVKNKWPASLGAPLFGMSRGPCEVCHHVGACHDVPSSALPMPSATPTAPDPLLDPKFARLLAVHLAQQEDKPMIVKIQQSLHTSDGVTRILIYNETRTVLYQTEDATECAEIGKLLGKRPRAFARAQLKNGKIEIDELVEDRTW